MPNDDVQLMPKKKATHSNEQQTVCQNTSVSNILRHSRFFSVLILSILKFCSDIKYIFYGSL